MMKGRWILISALLLGLLLALGAGLALAQGPQPPGKTSGPDIPAAPVSSTFTYQGFLKEGGAPANGHYSFRFDIYPSLTGGTSLLPGYLYKSHVNVVNGLFTVQLDFNSVAGRNLFTGDARYIEIGVAPDIIGSSFTVLSPRQELTAAPYAFSLKPGAIISGTGNIIIAYGSSNTYATIYGGDISPNGGYGLYGLSDKGTGVGGVSTNGVGLYGTATYTGVRGVAGSEGVGVYGLAGGNPYGLQPGTGVFGFGGDNYGVHGVSPLGTGVYGQSDQGTGVWGKTNFGDGVFGESIDGTGVSGSGSDCGVAGTSSGTGVSGSGSDYGVAGGSIGTGVSGSSTSSTGVYGSSYNSTGVKAESQYGHPIEAWSISPSDLRFYVSNVGDVYADGTWHTPAADMAEMLPAGEKLEPGDVLAVGPDGKLTRSTQPYQASVVGVYSTKPGFLGGALDGADLTGKVPLAVAGVVPVKVSAENGAIRPGDLLVASATPGHAMRAPANPAPGTVIGKALGSLDSGTGIIEMLVMLR